MKLETTLFDVPARILQGEEVMDSVRDIANHPGQEEPFVVMDVGDLVHKIKTWRLKMPRVKPFYAVKCNPNKTLLKILSSLGTGFDCASKAEIKSVVELGVHPSRIIYAHPCKPASHLRHANSAGVDLITFDNETELLKVKDIMPDARLVIRIRCDASSAQCLLGEKFGVELDQVLPLLSLAKTLDLNVVGVSFHVGSGCKEPEAFFRAIKFSREVFDLATEMGFAPYLLDIGGGFPGNSESSLDDFAEFVNCSLDEYFPEDDIQVIAEPGRYVVASAFTLATQVVSKRRVESSDDPSFKYYINDGVYGSFNCILNDHQVVTPQLLDLASDGDEDTDKERFSCSIWGPTCDSLDQVIEHIQLPEINVGDWIVWRDMGAYTISAACTFNGFPVPLVHVVVPIHAWLALEAILADASIPSISSSKDPELLHHHHVSNHHHHSHQEQRLIPTFLRHFIKDQDHHATDHDVVSRLHLSEI